ncbi:MAG: hypothetical protein KF842_14710 [Caulobacter sp.]|nr:hypothetical protein [Caulobacter sp.]
MRDNIEGCRRHENSACAALVADASRLGRRAWAWKVMLKNYDREDTWGVTFLCDPGNLDQCPASLKKPFRTFPEALAAFLDHTGYGPGPLVGRRRTPRPAEG